MVFLCWNENFKILVCLLCFYLGICLLIFLCQNKMLYQPMMGEVSPSPSSNPFPYRHPSEKNIDSQDVVLFTCDNLRLKGWLIKCDSPRVIVYMHENAGNIGYRIDFIDEISRKTMSNVLLIAYRGYSDSEGSPSEEGIKKDGQAIITYTLQRFREVYVYGRSLGGAVAIHIADKEGIKGIILENTFTSIGDTIDYVMPFLKYFKWVNINHWRSIDKISHINIPIMFIRCLKDQIVPTEHMIKLMNHAVKSKYITETIFRTGTHNVGWQLNPNQYFKQINQFIQHTK